MANIRSFVLSCLSLTSAITSAIASIFEGVADRSYDLARAPIEWVGGLFIAAFPPAPLHLDLFTDWRLSSPCMAAPFLAFIARVQMHARYLGGRFKLLRSPLLAV